MHCQLDDVHSPGQRSRGETPPGGSARPHADHAASPDVDAARPRLSPRCATTPAPPAGSFQVTIRERIVIETLLVSPVLPDFRLTRRQEECDLWKTLRYVRGSEIAPSRVIV